MRSDGLLLGAICFILNFLGTTAFANRPELGKENRSQSQVIAIVRLENNQPVCVKYADDIQLDQNREQVLPPCSDEGIEGAQARQAMAVAQTRSGTQTALLGLSHLFAGGGGCVFGLFTSISGGAFAISNDMDELAGTAAGAFVGLPVAYWLAPDPTGHLLAAGFGYVACAGGINYLAYLRKN